MKDIIKQWCETGQLTREQASMIIIEYCKLYLNEEPSAEDLQKIFMIHGSFSPINFERLIADICIKNDWYLLKVESIPDQFGNRRVLCYKFYE